MGSDSLILAQLFHDISPRLMIKSHRKVQKSHLIKVNQATPRSYPQFQWISCGTSCVFDCMKAESANKAREYTITRKDANTIELMA